jgi:uncharacterized protein YbjT (DUF2867 family)
MVLLTGASGYVGGRLLKHLQARGVRIRCLARKPDFLRGRVGPGVEIVRGDVLDEQSLIEALRGVDTAYYLVHAMGEASGFEEIDRRGAGNFASAARHAGIRRIIYLGGLGESASDLSPHLRSRHEVGEILRSSGVQVIEFRASVIIGSGSLSFEMIRALVERLPVMITPRWVAIRTQPIAINDVLEYLTQALTIPLDGNHIFEIGGADVVSYGDMMREYARQRGLRRYLVPVPLLTPRLSSLWLGLVARLYVRVGRKLIDSIRHATVVRDDSARRVFAVTPIGVREAIASALRDEDRQFAETRWSDALSSAGIRAETESIRTGIRIVDSRATRVDVAPEKAFAPIIRLGGARGWPYDWLWRLRGVIDLLVGGPGMRRGRRDPENLHVGDALDCWRVERYEPGAKLTLAAEMKLPGRAWLDFEIERDGDGSIIRQTAIFDPRGLFGLAYWYLSYPLHRLIFAAMLRQIAEEAIVEARKSR